MAKNRSMYKVDFSIDDMSLLEQQKVFETVVAMLDYDQRMKLHVTITDFLGGKHFVWDGTGEDPNGVKCAKCGLLDCEKCMLYMSRQKLQEGENDDGNDFGLRR